MKSVSHSEWLKKAEGLAEWRKNRKTPPNLDLYRKIVSMVHVGYSALDAGCGQCHLEKCLPKSVFYAGIDPFPVGPDVEKMTAEELLNKKYKGLDLFDTVFMLAALDNVQDVSKALKGLKNVAAENIVILTGIGIPVDQNHTHTIERSDLIEVLGEPFQEVEMSPRVWLYEFKVC